MIIAAPLQVCRADNPIIQTKFTADPAPLVHDGTLYLYTSHDEDDATGFTMFNWLLYSTTDMANWTDHGVIGGVAEPYKTFSWASGYNAWAPQAVYRNGKIYLYCPLVSGGHMDIGVAVSDSPTGPFVDAIGRPLIHNPNSTDDIDPTVFIDEDGQAYLYWGHQRLFYVKLNADMISYSGGIVELPRPRGDATGFEEGPWFYRRGGHYYLAFASYCCPEGIGYAMSDSPTGPWAVKGHLMRPNGASSGNHPGIVDYKGDSYVFGFNYALNFALTTEHRERRSICVEKMSYAADGTIPEVPWWSTAGVPQIGTLDPYVRTEAETIAWSSGVKTESCSEGGMDVCNIENGDYLKVKGVDFGAGARSFEARVASATAGGAIELRLDGSTGMSIGRCAVPGTGGWQTWKSVTCAVSGATGVHDLYLVFTGGSGSLFNFDWWRFERSSGSSSSGGSSSGGSSSSSGSSGGSGSGGSSGGGSSGSSSSGGSGSGSDGSSGGGSSGSSSSGGTASSSSGGSASSGGAASNSSSGGGNGNARMAVGGCATAGGSMGVPAVACLALLLRRRRRSPARASTDS
jgi:hypothetical protein